MPIAQDPAPSRALARPVNHDDHHPQPGGGGARSPPSRAAAATSPPSSADKKHAAAAASDRSRSEGAGRSTQAPAATTEGQRAS